MLNRNRTQAIPTSPRARLSPWAVVRSTLLSLSIIASTWATSFGVQVALETAAGAQTVSSTTGPVDAVTHFPAWYGDAKGTRLELCLDGAPNCLASLNDITPNATGATGEAFYFDATTNLNTSGGKSLLVLATEAAFTNGAPKLGEESTFNRTRIRIQTKDTGNFTVTWPYGHKTYRVDKVDSQRFEINDTIDLGCIAAPANTCNDGVAPDFGAVGPWFGGEAGDGARQFLEWASSGPADVPPAGFLGDAATAHKVTGGTEDNVFRVVGPKINPNDKVDGCPTWTTPHANADCIETTLFTVQGKKAGPLVSNPARKVDLGTTAVGTSATPKPVTLTNVGPDALTVATATIDGTEFTVDPTSNCNGATLARDQSCTVTVDFTPSLAGVRTATLQVTHDKLNSPLKVSLSGTGTTAASAPAVGLSAQSLDFGSLHVGAVSKPQSLTVTNTGTGPLLISNVALAGANIDYQFATKPNVALPDCLSTTPLDPQQKCQIDVTFAPAEVGTLSAELQITDNATGSPHKVTLTGVSQPGITAMGPIVKMGPPGNETSNFPAWYQDVNGLKLMPCLDGLAVCFAAAADLTPPDGEAFWMGADALIDLPGGHRARLVLSTEAAYAAAGTGQEITFNRVRAVTDQGALTPGHYYLVTHPYGEDLYQADDGGALRPKFATSDVGCLTPPCYNTANPNDGTSHFGDLMAGRIGPFLRWTGSDAPLGYTGDANTPHTVTGSPSGNNYFALREVDAGGNPVPSGLDVRTDLFTVQGKILGPGPVVLTTASGAPAAGTFAGPQQVSIAVTDPASAPANSVDNTGVSIYYTTDGTEPTLASTKYTGPVTVSTTSTIKALAVNGIGGVSRGSAAVVIGAAGPTLTASPLGNTYSGPQTVTLTSTPAAPIYYTLDGSAPAPTSNQDNTVPGSVLYTGPITISTTTTLKAMAVDSVGAQSNVLNETYAISNGQQAAGPVNPNTGFPAWYRDTAGQQLELCLDGLPNCIASAGDVTPNTPGATGEAFYWRGFASAPTPGGTAKLILATEGAFATGAPAVGQQITFNRIKITMNGLTPNGTYRVTHPYGQETINTNNLGVADKFLNQAGCAAAPCNFNDALVNNPIRNFLRWDAAAPAPPTGFLGAPGALHTVTGSPLNTNLFRVEEMGHAPDGSVTWTVVAETNEFDIQGKIAGGNVTASPAGGTYSTPQSVTLTSSDPTATIYYTLNGSTPDPVNNAANTIKYDAAAKPPTAPINISTSTTLKAVAMTASGPGPVLTEIYTFNTTAPTVSANPPSSTQLPTNGVTLTSNPPNLHIFYTTDGVSIPSPTDSSGKTLAYTGPIPITKPTTLKFMVVDAAGNQSAVVTETYGVFPTVASVSPNSVGQGAPAQALTVTGTNFQTGATVSVSGTGITVNSTTVTDAAHLTVNVSVAADATISARDLTITNPDGGSVTAAGALTVTVPVAPAPTFTSVTPNSLVQGVTKTLAIAGTNFQTGAAVSFSGTGITVNSTTFTDASNLAVNVTVAAGAATGARDLTITNPDGQKVTATGALSVTAAPTFTSASPSSLVQGTTKAVVFTGSNFQPNATLTFSGTGVTATLTNATPTQLTANVTVGVGTATGARDLTITNPDGGSVTATGALAITAAPTFTSMAPTSLAQGATSAVSITGTNFQAGATLSFSGTGVTGTVTGATATQLSANVTVAAGAATGARDLTITNPDGGTVTATGVFTVTQAAAPAPTFTSVAPNSLLQGAAQQTLSIVGGNFQSGANVTFSGTGITAGVPTVADASHLTVIVSVASNAAAGARDLTITNPDGQKVTATGAFTVTADTTVPTTPGALSASVISPTRVDLTWRASTDNVGVAGYNVYRNATKIATIGTATNYSDTTVVTGTRYSYQVEAFDAAGNLSARSNTANAKP